MSEQRAHLIKAGKYIANLRKKVDGLTQREMAKQLGIEYFTFISQVENGFARVPRAALADWARVLKVPQFTFAEELLKHYEPEIYSALNDIGIFTRKDAE